MNTCSTASIAESSRVRSTQTSTTVRARDTDKDEKLASWSLVKQTTSQRPSAGAWASSGFIAVPAVAVGAVDPSVMAPAADGDPPANDGNRFSKTTTSYSWAGISEGMVPPPDGHSGHSFAGGRNVRSWRWSAIEIHSPVSASRRIVPAAGRTTSGRLSTISRLVAPLR